MKILGKIEHKKLFENLMKKLEAMSITEYQKMLESEEIFNIITEAMNETNYEKVQNPPHFFIPFAQRSIEIDRKKIIKIKEKIFYFLERAIIIEDTSENNFFFFFLANDNEAPITNFLRNCIKLTIYEPFTYEIIDVRNFKYEGDKIISGKDALKLLNDFIDHLEQIFKDEEEFVLYPSLKKLAFNLRYDYYYLFDLDEIKIYFSDFYSTFYIRLQRIVTGEIQTILQVYAQNNSEPIPPHPFLLQLADNLQALLSNIDIAEWNALTKNEKINLCLASFTNDIDYEAFLKKNNLELILMNDREIKISLQKDGYHEARLIFIEPQETLTNQLRDKIEEINENSKWKIEYNNLPKILQKIINIPPNSILDGNTLKKLINKICHKIEIYYAEDPGILYGYESNQRPIKENEWKWKWTGDTFRYKVSEEEIIIQYNYTDIEDKDYKLFHCTIKFIPTSL